MVFFDGNFRHGEKVKPYIKEFEQLLSQGKFVEAKSVQADNYIVQFADSKKFGVISNDRYQDEKFKQYKWLQKRESPRLVRMALADNLLMFTGGLNINIDTSNYTTKSAFKELFDLLDISGKSDVSNNNPTPDSHVYYTRSELLYLNIISALKSTFYKYHIDEEIIENLKYVIKHQQINSFMIYATRNDETVCEYVFNINWDIHNSEIKKQAKIKHQSHWGSDGTVPMVIVANKTFNEVARDFNLTKGLAIDDELEANKSRKRAKNMLMGYNEHDPHLKELNIQFLIDENL